MGAAVVHFHFPWIIQLVRLLLLDIILILYQNVMISIRRSNKQDIHFRHLFYTEYKIDKQKS